MLVTRYVVGYYSEQEGVIMATTAQQVLDLAIQRSSLNNPDLFPAAQVVRYIANAERAAYLLAAKLNPEYFGANADTSTRSGFVDPWDLNVTPGGVASVTRAEVKTITGTVTNDGVNIVVGDKVNLVSYRWPQLDLSPRAYIRGRKLSGYLTELGAANDNMVTVLDLFYAQLPAGVTTLSATLSLPDEWVDLLVLPLAKNFALRDQRAAEIAAIDDEYKLILSVFTQAVEFYDAGAIRPIQSVPLPTALDASGAQQ